MANGLTNQEKKAIAEEGKNLLVTEAISEEPNLGNQLSLFYSQYLIPARGEAKAQAMYDIYRADPTIVPAIVNLAHEQHENGLVTKVKGNETKITKGIKESPAIKIAEKYIGNGSYWALKTELEKGETGNIIPVFAIRYDAGDNLWAATITMATLNAVIGAAKNDITRTRTRELRENIYTQKDKKPVYNSGKFA